MILSRVKHTKKMGGAIEMLLAAELSAKGYDVFKEVSDSSRTDMIVKCKGGRLVKIQVKSAKTSRTGSVIVGLRHCGPTSTYWYTKEDVDIFALYSLEIRKFLFVPFELLNLTKTLSIRTRPTKNKQIAKIQLAESFMSFEKLVEAEVVATSR